MQPIRPSHTIVPPAHERQPAAAPGAVIYPESDDEPMGETGVHATELMRLFAMLTVWFRQRLDLYLAIDQFVYWVEGHPEIVVCPDLFAAVGVASQPPRPTYKVWEEGAPPSFVIEIVSQSSRQRDEQKLMIYQGIGVQEYVLYDPLEEWLQPPLRGYRLGPAGAEPLPEASEGGLLSEVLGLRLVLEERPLPATQAAGASPRQARWLALYDRRTGERLLAPLEAAEARQMAEARVAELEALLKQ